MFEEFDSVDLGGSSEFKNVADDTHIAQATVSFEPSKDGLSQVMRTKFYFPKDKVTEHDLFYIDNNPKKLKRFLAVARSFGFSQDKVSQAAAFMKTVDGWTVEVKKETNGKYRNYYVNKVIEKPQAKQPDPVSMTPPWTPSDSDLPF